MKKYLTTDRMLQSVLFIPYVFCGTIGALGLLFDNEMMQVLLFYMILHFCIGVYQVLSGIIGGFAYGDEKRKKYLLMNIAFFSIGFLGSLLMEGANYQVMQTLGMIYWFIIPSGIAIWYYTQTLKDFAEVQQEYV